MLTTTVSNKHCWSALFLMCAFLPLPKPAKQELYLGGALNVLCRRALQGAGKTVPARVLVARMCSMGKAQELYVYDAFLYVLDFPNCFS